MKDDKYIDLEYLSPEKVEIEEVDDSNLYNLEEDQVVPLTPETVEEAPSEEETSGSTSLVTYDPLQHYLMEIKKYRFLTKEEEFELAVKYKKEGDMDAISKLIMANLKIVVIIAMEYKNLGINLMDLIQEGNLGLMQAIKKFDPYRGLRLATYASWWIRAYILRYILNNWRLVKIGTTQAQRKLFFNLMKEKARLEALGKDTAPKLLADDLGVKEKEVIEMDQRLTNPDISLNEPVRQDGNTPLMSFISSDEIPVDEKIAKKELSKLFRDRLEEFARTLNERDLYILRQRILAEKPLSLNEIGKTYGISKERVRQLEEKIITRLREYLKQEIHDFEALRPE